MAVRLHCTKAFPRGKPLLVHTELFDKMEFVHRIDISSLDDYKKMCYYVVVAGMVE